MHDRTEHVCATVIRHPMWCEHVAPNAPRAGDPVGSPTYYDLLGVAEPNTEHEGRTYTLDAGTTFAYTVSATPTQWYEDSEAPQVPQVRLDCRNHEMGGDSTIYLDAAEVGRLITMLEHVKSDIDHVRG